MSSGLLRKYIDLFEEDKPLRIDVVDGPVIAFIGDSIAYGLSGKMMTGSRTDAAVGLTSNAIANRVARNKGVQNANYAVISAGTNDFATGKGDAAALESNLAAIRSSLKAIVNIWLGPYNPEANAVVKKFAKSHSSDVFLDLNKYPADSLGIHPRDYVAVANDLLRLGVDSRRDSENKGPSLIDKKLGGETEPTPRSSGSSPAPILIPSPASTSTEKPEVEKSPPGDISQYKGKVKKLRADFKAKFGRDLPITSQERTRAEQQDLYDRWRRGEKGIYIPIDPATQPGREIFHNTAIDVSPALNREEEAWMNNQGWVRTLPEKDPVHYEYQGSWDAAPSASKDNKDNTVTPQGRTDLDKLGQILRKKVKEDSQLVNQLTPQEQMQFWRTVVEADRKEPTFSPDTLDPPVTKDPQVSPDPQAKKPRVKVVRDGAGFAVVAPNGQRFGGFVDSVSAQDWAYKPENAKMLGLTAPTSWIGGTPNTGSTPPTRDLNLKPLSGFDKFKQAGSFPKTKGVGKAATALGVLGAVGNYAYNKFRDQDLKDYSSEDQEYIKKMLPMLKDYYNDVDKFQSELDRDQQLQVVDYINTLKKLPSLKSEFPANSKWDAYVRTID